MIVESIDYSQHDGTSQEWQLEGCTLGKINLIVGENASGKSKVLNIIGNLGDLLSGDRELFLSANYKITYSKDGDKIDYVLKSDQSAIIEERLDINRKNLLNRRVDGIGKIFFQKLNKKLDFQIPSDQAVSVARRDAIQHPFLENLYDWGKSTRRYYFGTQLGKDNFLVPLKAKEGEPRSQPNLKDPTKVVAMFIDAQKRFSSQFTDSIIQDMEAIGYELREIGTATPISIVFKNAPGEVFGIYAKEADLSGITDQHDMSQGMFRALSLIIQITYSQFTNKPACILIDDIGEGLDYNRSTALVKLLIEKAQKMPFQLVMTTNDRFVMNNVPLEYWSVMQRISAISKIYNYRNSPELFKEFELTGLNNFDFFSSRFYLKDNTEN